PPPPGRGLRVALVDSSDFAGGTSSRSSRLVHGGLRYLETFDFGLVFEALRERRRLLELAPHLVHAIPFLFPVYAGDPTGMARLRAGMLLYEVLSLFRSPRRHRMLGRSGALEAEPLLRREKLRGGALYYDAQVDDARLTLAVARAAREAGATTLSHAAAVELVPGLGEAGHAVVEDRLSGRTARVDARVILNATGPWTDRVRAMADPNVESRLRPTKGVHVLVDRARVGNRNAIIFRSPVDDRVMFVLPWDEFTYIGTTDTEFSGDPSDAIATLADVEYLLTSANSIFPEAGLTTEDVFSTWAGVRPLLAPDGADGLSESATSREHAIWRDDSGLVNVAGGKLTTYRSMAEETADAVAELLREEFGVRSGPYFTEYLPLPGAPDEDTPRLHGRAKALGLEDQAAHDLVGRYGSAAQQILELIEAEPALAERIVETRPYLKAEVVHGVRHEMALTLQDVLRRRLQLFYDVADGGLSAAVAVAELMAREEGIRWDPATVEREVEQYAAAVRQTRPRLTN
ncbi:MAG: glycerol-3-phosphate dehydrogenase/oxidase, partial [Gemmatimonadota bacterium]